MRQILLTMTVVLGVANASLAAFTFENVADTSGQFQQVTSATIGSDGTVAFEGTLRSGISGIFTYKNGQLTTIADTTQGYTSFNTIPAVNGHGEVAFTGARPDGGTVFKYSNGVVTKLPMGYSGPSPSINDSGQVAVINGSGAQVSSGTTVQTYSTGYFPSGNPVINNKGVVAFVSVLPPAGCYISDGTHIVQALSNAVSYVSMNDSNVEAIAVAGFGFFGQSTILTGDGKTTHTIATVSGSSPHDGLTSFYTASAPPINDDGLVAFQADDAVFSQPISEEAIYLGSQWARVIGTGDSLFGSTIVTGQGTEITQGFGLTTNRASFVGNELVFSYYLANGVQGIAIAHVPEPASLSVLTISAFALLSRRRRVMRPE